MSLKDRAALHHALGEPTRLRIVDTLQLSDRSPVELIELAGVSTNLLAFHLNVLEDAGLIARGPSQGDARRRYVRLCPERIALLSDPQPLSPPPRNVLFVCTANSARSPLAAFLWHAYTGLPALSAGTHPAEQVHPEAIAVARSHGLDLSGVTPRRHDDLGITPDLVVSVCDRAHEATLDVNVRQLHWSVPDPIGGGPAEFSRTYDLLTERIERLAHAVVVA